MDVLLLSGYRHNFAEIALEKLDVQITATKELGLNPIVVLSGPDADEILRHSNLIHSCELVFDTNDEVSIMSNLKSGIHAASETCYVLPLEVPCPEKPVWVGLKRAFQRTGFTTKTAVIQLADDQGAPLHWGFPLYLTRLGRHLLLNEENLRSLTDPRLNYFLAPGTL